MNCPDQRRFDLLLRYLDGNLPSSELGALNRLLREDPEAAAWLREIAQQAVGLGDIARREEWVERAGEAGADAAAGGTKQAEKVGPAGLPGARSHPPAKRLQLGWMLSAAVLALLAGLVARELWLGQRAESSIATLSAASGSVVRQEIAGARQVIHTGQELGAGSLATEGEGSTAEVRFADGTTLGLAGNTEIAISEDGRGKQVRLRQGVVTVTVAEQPDDRPLRVQTATAEIEVIGTIFTVGAEAEATRVEVGRGKVQVRRLVDGREIEVGAHRRTFASLDASEAFIAEARSPVPWSWRQRFDRAGIEGWRGSWRPAGPEGPASWGAQPYLAGRQADGTPIMHRGLVGRASISTPGQHFVAISSDSVLTLRYRTAAPQKVMVFLSTHEPDGTFGGNFEALIPAIPDGAPDYDVRGDGWREVVLPLASFRAASPGHLSMEAGSEVFLLLISTREAEADLQVAEAGIHPAASLPKTTPQ